MAAPFIVMEYIYWFTDLKIINNTKNNVITFFIPLIKNIPDNFWQSSITYKILLTEIHKYGVSNSTKTRTNYCVLKNSRNHWEMIFINNVRNKRGPSAKLLIEYNRDVFAE